MEKTHSRIGIASFILAVLSIAGMIGCVIGAVSTAALIDPTALVPGETPDISESGLGGFLAIAGLMFLFLITALIGAVLGLVGMFQKEKLKLFSVLGLTFNSLLVLVFLLIFIVITLLGPTLPGTF
jgi:hypothetical protein